jgi:hypothetical protein
MSVQIVPRKSVAILRVLGASGIHGDAEITRGAGWHGDL